MVVMTVHHSECHDRAAGSDSADVLAISVTTQRPNRPTIPVRSHMNKNNESDIQ